MIFRIGRAHPQCNKSAKSELKRLEVCDQGIDVAGRQMRCLSHSIAGVAGRYQLFERALATVVKERNLGPDVTQRRRIVRDWRLS